MVEGEIGSRAYIVVVVVVVVAGEQLWSCKRADRFSLLSVDVLAFYSAGNAKQDTPRAVVTYSIHLEENAQERISNHSVTDN